MSIREEENSADQEFEADIQTLAEKNLSPLPVPFSREDIYFNDDETA